MLVFTDKSKDAMKKHEELRNKIRTIIRSLTNNSGNYDMINMKIRFDPDGDLLLNKILQIN